MHSIFDVTSAFTDKKKRERNNKRKSPELQRTAKRAESFAESLPFVVCQENLAGFHFLANMFPKRPCFSLISYATTNHILAYWFAVLFQSF